MIEPKKTVATGVSIEEALRILGQEGFSIESGNWALVKHEGFARSLRGKDLHARHIGVLESLRHSDEKILRALTWREFARRLRQTDSTVFHSGDFRTVWFFASNTIIFFRGREQ